MYITPFGIGTRIAGHWPNNTINMNTYKNPSWWTKDNDSGWDRVKEAFKRDWDQTKHDFGGKQPDTAQNVNDTVKQASGNQPIPPRGVPVYEKAESAYRFGYGAKTYYQQKYPKWDTKLETELQRDWKASYPQGIWDEDVVYIRRGWDYDDDAADLDDDQIRQRKAA
jgi:hypothetical protein